ncbi:hypothetical protein TTRE_0000434201 [Trichuris trichiura]|uniref:Uncharacterized protein n=1 Tax=Trichuris trichiura TaxID=36087 RepID=A0A077Z8T2_TRITR|nr:hypothetical protein TTRE_0000434201 [Trichuris trichiura]
MSTKSPRPVLLPRQYENYRTCSNCSMRLALSDQGVITRSSINSQSSVEVVRNSSVQHSSGDPCNRCRKMFFRKRFRQGRCQVYQCVGQLRRCWTEKSLPADFSKLDAAMKQGLLAEYRLNPDSFTSCFNCIKRIKQKINNFLNLYNDEVNDDEPYSSAISCFTEEEQRMLRDVLFSGCCSSWDEVANQIPNKSAKECKRYANENKSVIFDCTLLTSAVESVHEHAESNGRERNGSETIGAPSENTTTTSAKNAEPVAVQPPYTCLRAVLNAISSVEPVTTSEEAPCQGVEPSSNRTSQNQGTTTSAKNAEPVIVQPKDTCVRAVLAAISTVEPMVSSEEAPRQRVEPSGNHRSPIQCTTSSAKNAEPVIVQPKGTCVRAVLNAISTAEPMTATEEAPRQPVEPSSNRTIPKPSWNMKFAFHPSSPCAKLQEEAMASTSAVTKQNTDSRRSTDASFALPKDVGSNGVAAFLENASVGRQSAVMPTSPWEVESSSFNVRPLLCGCSSISSETGSGVHLNNSNYLNNFATLPIMPLSFGPGHSMNDWYAGGISSTTNGAFGGQPIDLGRPRPTPIAECLYSNLCSPGVNGSMQYSIDSMFGRQQRLEPGISACAHSNVVPQADHRKRLVQRSRTERINPKMICNGICASVPTVSAAYAGIGQNNFSAPFAGNAYQPLNGFTFSPSSHTFQYPSFAGYQAESANSLINQSNLNGYGASPFYAAGNDYHETVQNSLLQYVGYPLYIRNVNPPQYVMGSISNRRIAERQEPAIPTTSGTSSVVASSSSNGSNRGKTKVEQVFTFLDCSDDESL